MININNSNEINIYKRLMLFTVGMIVICLGTTLMMKANLGQTSMSSFAKNVEFLTKIKSGTILAIANYVFFVIQIALLGKEFKIGQVFQLLITSIFGMGVNYFSYNLSLTANINPDVYFAKWICLITSLVLTGFGVAAMQKADLIFMPFEGFCNAVVYRSKKPFSKVRPIIDASIVSISVVLIFAFNIPNTTVREGTVFATIMFGKIVGWCNKNIFK